MFDVSFSHLVTNKSAKAVSLVTVDAAGLKVWQKTASAIDKAWVKSTGFSGSAGSSCLLPGESGSPQTALVGLGSSETDRVWDWAKIFDNLPAGDYVVADAAEGERALLGRLLGAYAFDRYKSKASDGSKTARVVMAKSDARRAVERTARGVWLVRDLVNEPAGDLGPSALADVAKRLAKHFKARCQVIVGNDLLKKNFPAIHAVGRASSDAPRLIDIRWGNPKHPKVSLVGKGVTFDTGGLDIKSAAGMKYMKKDMGGAAHVLALASMIMDAKLPVRLRVLVPAVENAIAGNAMRPLDVVPTRSGLTVEIGNTDAEGRVIMSDAITEAIKEQPSMLIDCATLTGAARVALGTEMPALFCNNDDLANDLLAASAETGDPLWRMPLWQGYNRFVDGKVADITNAPDTGYGGAITAALFLERFVNATPKAHQAPVAWAHIDMMAYNLSNRPGRPEGGEAMGLRAMFTCIANRFAS